MSNIIPTLYYGNQKITKLQYNGQAVKIYKVYHGSQLCWSEPDPEYNLVRFYLNEHGIRVGGGEMAQVVKFKEDAISPQIQDTDLYTFNGWDKSIENVITNLSVNAVYIKPSLVNFDYESHALCIGGGEKQQLIKYNCDATLPLLSVEYGWQHDGWDKSELNIQSDCTISALYHALERFNVIFDLDGKAVRTGGGDLQQSIPLHYSATVPEIQSINKYTFNYWDKDFNDITSDLTVTAQYLEPHTVTFDAGEHGTIDDPDQKVQLIAYNQGAVEPDVNVNEHYTLTSWSVPFDHITTDLTVVAQYEVKVNSQIYYIDGTEENFNINGIATNEVLNTSENTNVKKVVFANNVTGLQADLFKNCTALEEVYLTENCTKFDSSVFEGCTNLTAITFS